MAGNVRSPQWENSPVRPDSPLWVHSSYQRAPCLSRVLGGACLLHPASRWPCSVHPASPVSEPGCPWGLPPGEGVTHRGDALGRAGLRWAVARTGAIRPREEARPQPRQRVGGGRTGNQAHGPPATGAVVLDVACFAEAERLYMLVRDTAVHGRPLTALVLPDVLVSGAGAGPGAIASMARLSNTWSAGAKSESVCTADSHRGRGPRSDGERPARWLTGLAAAASEGLACVCDCVCGPRRVVGPGPAFPALEASGALLAPWASSGQ